MVYFPNAKINIGLYVVKKRVDGYHDIETLFYPVQVRDAVEIVPGPVHQDPLVFTASGTALPIDAEANLCVKAYRLLKAVYPDLPSVCLHLHKTIPIGGGLGGGSADGAFTLMLLNRKFNLNLTRNQLLKYALELGSDCPFFIINQPCSATGRGDQLQAVELDLSAYKIMLVNPGIQINTGWAFSRVTPEGRRPPLHEVIGLPVLQWPQRVINDFERPVFDMYPEIASIRERLYDSGALYASMTGTGATVYGIFEKEKLPAISFPSHYFVKTV